MKLQKIILIFAFVIFGGISSHAQQPTAKDLYFGYKPRTERRQQTKPTPVSTNRQKPDNRTNSNNTASSRGRTNSTSTSSRRNNGAKSNATATGLPGTKITIELMRNGKLRFVSPNFQFRSGDKIRLRMATNFEGYVTVLNLGSSGKVNLLYPIKNENGEYRNNYVTPTSDYQIPPGNGWIVFDEKKGTETVTVIMSADPIKGLSNLDRNSAYFKRNKTSKDLFIQTVGTDFYAVCPEETLDETVGFSLKLKHQ